MATSIIVGTNSWCTLSEAESYFATRIGSSAWSALSSDTEKEKYLISAYNWIRYDSAFSVTGDETLAPIKYGQCEGALFLASFYDEYMKREALIASGVTEFTYSKWSETLGETRKPESVTRFFQSLGLYSGSFGIAQCADSTTWY